MLKPKLFTIWKTITKDQLINDITAGIIVGIIALPLAIALAIASGVSPEKGIITAVIGGFIVSLLGGSRVQIAGPTGAFVVILYGIVMEYGINGLYIATIMAGIILIIMGVAKLGTLIKFIPYPVTVGFTSGIAVVIFSLQINDLLGMGIEKVPSDFAEKWVVYFYNISHINVYAAMIGFLSLAIIAFWPKISRKIPGSLIAIIVSTLLVSLLKLDVQTIGSKFNEIQSSIPMPSLPDLKWDQIRNLMQPAIAIAMLSAIEALLSAVVADGMIEKKHRSNMELVAQGIANIVSPLFGGIPVTGAIARTAANIKNGGRTPIAGIVHSIVLLLIMLFLGKWASLIPMPTLGAILIVVAYNMSEWRTFKGLLKSPGGDVAVLLTTFFLTVIFDLTLAIEVGLVLAVLLFMRRMTQSVNVDVVSNMESEEDSDDDPLSIQLRQVPERVDVYEINGPFFFGAAAKFRDAVDEQQDKPQVRIFRLRNVPVMDATGLYMFKEVYKSCIKSGIKVVLSGVHPAVYQVMEKDGFLEIIGKANVTDHIDKALIRTKEVLREN